MHTYTTQADEQTVRLEADVDEKSEKADPHGKADAVDSTTLSATEAQVCRKTLHGETAKAFETAQPAADAGGTGPDLMANG